MDLVKKNIVSVICGVIALVCVVLIFFPLGGMYAAMTTNVKKSKEIGDNLTKVRTEKRSWPTLSTDPAAAQPLPRFPTDAIIKTGTDVTASWTKQKDEFVQKAVEVQSKSLTDLVPGVLPGNGGAQYLRTRFMETYATLMNLNHAVAGAAGGQAAGPSDVPQGPPKPVLNTPLVGRMPPLDAEIKARGDVEEANIRRDMPRVINGVVVNQAEVDQEVINRRAQIGDQIRTEAAKQSMVYVDPYPGPTQSFIASDKIVGSAPPSYDDIFLAQTGLWLQQEICRAVYDVNKPAIDAAAAANKGNVQGVVDAPIKRLIGIRFTLPYQPPAPPAPGTPAPTDVPAVPPMPAARVAVNFANNPLGQTSNDLYDVLPFRLSLVVEAESLTQTLAGLTHNRYIAIRGLDVTAVDAALAYTQGFIFGGKPVVQVDLRGQYLMMRPFIGTKMPPGIIRGLAAPVTPAAGEPAA